MIDAKQAGHRFISPCLNMGTAQLTFVLLRTNVLLQVMPDFALDGFVASYQQVEEVYSLLMSAQPAEAADAWGVQDDCEPSSGSWLSRWWFRLRLKWRKGQRHQTSREMKPTTRLLVVATVATLAIAVVVTSCAVAFMWTDNIAFSKSRLEQTLKLVKDASTSFAYRRNNDMEAARLDFSTTLLGMSVQHIGYEVCRGGGGRVPCPCVRLVPFARVEVSRRWIGCVPRWCRASGGFGGFACPLRSATAPAQGPTALPLSCTCGQPLPSPTPAAPPRPRGCSGDGPVGAAHQSRGRRCAAGATKPPCCATRAGPAPRLWASESRAVATGT